MTTTVLRRRFPAVIRTARSLALAARAVWNAVNSALPPDAELYDALRVALNDGDDVFFVQIGSNDGVGSDPIRPFAQHNPQWRGILVEPVPAIFRTLRQNYGDSPRFHFVNAAVGETRGTRPFYVVGPRARRELREVPVHLFDAWFSKIGSFDRRHLETECNGMLAPIVQRDPLGSQRHG